jgi:hypothetical protein
MNSMHNTISTAEWTQVQFLDELKRHEILFNSSEWSGEIWYFYLQRERGREGNWMRTSYAFTCSLPFHSIGGIAFLIRSQKRYFEKLSWKIHSLPLPSSFRFSTLSYKKNPSLMSAISPFHSLLEHQKR